MISTLMATTYMDMVYSNNYQKLFPYMKITETYWDAVYGDYRETNAFKYIVCSKVQDFRYLHAIDETSIESEIKKVRMKFDSIKGNLAPNNKFVVRLKSDFKRYLDLKVDFKVLMNQIWIDKINYGYQYHIKCKEFGFDLRNGIPKAMYFTLVEIFSFLYYVKYQSSEDFVVRNALKLNNKFNEFMSQFMKSYKDDIKKELDSQCRYCIKVYIKPNKLTQLLNTIYRISDKLEISDKLTIESTRRLYNSGEKFLIVNILFKYY